MVFLQRCQIVLSRASNERSFTCECYLPTDSDESIHNLNFFVVGNQWQGAVG